MLHCKPFSRTSGFNVSLGSGGDANDWRAILKAAGERCLAVLVESESEALSGMENARACIEGLKRFIPA